MPNNFKQLEGVDEGEVIINWWIQRFKANKNFLIPTIGQTGSGKSYLDLRLAELYYKKVFNRPFPQENIVFNIPDAVKLIRSGKLERGEIIIIEEAGVIMNSLDFQNKIVKFFGFVLQSFRSKNIGIIFNLPTISMLNKTSRLLCHGIIQTTTIDRNSNKVIAKVFYTQTNPMTGKQYNKYIRQKINGKMITVKRIAVSMPSSSIITIYESRKEQFVNNTADKLIDFAEGKKDEEISVLQQQIRKLWLEGMRRLQDFADKLNVSVGSVSKNITILRNKGLLDQNV